MRSGTRGPADRPPPRPAPAPASFAAQQLHLLPQPALRGGARGGHPPGEDRHPDRVVGDRASLRGRAGGAPLYRGAHPCRRHRPGRGVPALPRRARRALQPRGDPRDRRRRRQHERLDPDQACRGRDAGPGLSSAVATKPAAAATPPREAFRRWEEAIARLSAGPSVNCELDAAAANGWCTVAAELELAGARSSR